MRGLMHGRAPLRTAVGWCGGRKEPRGCSLRRRVSVRLRGPTCTTVPCRPHPTRTASVLLCQQRDQCQAERLHVREVPVEGRRHHPGATRHFTQAEAAEATPLGEQFQGRVHQLLARGRALRARFAHALQRTATGFGVGLARHYVPLAAARKSPATLSLAAMAACRHMDGVRPPERMIAGSPRAGAGAPGREGGTALALYL